MPQSAQNGLGARKDPTFLGETVGIAIHLAPGSTLTEDELRVHLEPKLAGFKIPEHVWFRDEPLPQNASGKFLKRALQEELTA